MSSSYHQHDNLLPPGIPVAKAPEEEMPEIIGSLSTPFSGF